jgi:hypothetical protein
MGYFVAAVAEEHSSYIRKDKLKTGDYKLNDIAFK